MLHTKTPRVALLGERGRVLVRCKGKGDYVMRSGSVQHLERSSSTEILALKSDTIHETTFVAYVVYISIKDNAL